MSVRSLLSLNDVGFAYGPHPALSHVNLDVMEGEFLGIIGPNSGGKSTLLRVMSRAVSSWSGEVQLLERALESWNLQELARTVARVSSEDYFAFPFTVEQIVLMGRTPYLSRWGLESARDHAVAEEMMKAVDVWPLRQRSIQELSSGERQRVLLARALAQEPRLLLLDEPSAHLDIGHQWALFELLTDLHRSRGLTVVCVLHDLSLAAKRCRRIALLHQGTIHALGAPSTVMTAQNLHTIFGIPLEILHERTLA